MRKFFGGRKVGHLFCQNWVYSLCHNLFLNLPFLMFFKWDVGSVPFTALCVCMGKLWCGLCEVTPSVSRTRGWLERPCILLCGWCSSLNRSLVGSGVVFCCLGKLVREIITLATVEDMGKTSFTASWDGWMRWASSLEMWLAGDAPEGVREGCAMVGEQ